MKMSKKIKFRKDLKNLPKYVYLYGLRYIVNILSTPKTEQTYLKRKEIHIL